MPHPSRHRRLLLSPPYKIEVESDPAKLISDDSSLKINQRMKFGTLLKPMFSLFDVII